MCQALAQAHDQGHRVTIREMVLVAGSLQPSRGFRSTPHCPSIVTLPVALRVSVSLLSFHKIRKYLLNEILGNPEHLDSKISLKKEMCLYTQ